MAASAAAALLYSSTRPSAYEATAEVFIGPRTAASSNVSTALEELTFSGEFIASYARLLRSRAMAERVVELLELDVAPATLAGRISPSIVPDTRIIQVRVSDGSPDRAAQIANTLVEIFADDVQSEFGGDSVRPVLFEPAIPPSSRSSPAPVRDGILGGLLGLFAGFGTAVLLEQLDTRLHTGDEVEIAVTPLPVLAAVPRLPPEDARQRNFAIEHDPQGAVAESFRILRTNVQFLGVDRPIRRLLIAGALAGDGKTTVAANLAAALAAAGCRTLLMETDLRRPTVHEYIRRQASPGISELLLGQSTLRLATRSTTLSNLQILTSGAVPPNPSELLGSRRMIEILDQASATHDMLILDTPPTLPVTDAVLLAPRTDGVIIVVRAGKTTRRAALGMAEQFNRVGGRVLGVVFNAAAASDPGYDYEYYQRNNGNG